MWLRVLWVLGLAACAAEEDAPSSSDSESPRPRVTDAFIPPDARPPDARPPDARLPDARLPDARLPDAQTPDGPPPDVRVADMARRDAGASPAEPVTDDPLPPAQPPGRVETTMRDGFTDDYLYSPDGSFKVGVRREWGGTIIFFGFAGDDPGSNTTNVVDAHDTGREVQVALYDPERSVQGCAHDASCANGGGGCANSITFLGWNPVQGGNECNRGSGVEAVRHGPGVLDLTTRPLHWNPDWGRPDCGNDGCGVPALRELRSDVVVRQRLRFVHSHIVELRLEAQNLTDMAHAPTLQEFPTLYATFGHAGTPDLHRLFDSTGREIPIDRPANDGFFFTEFDSPGGWAALQDGALTYGVGLYYENRVSGFQGWQRRGTFNNLRARFRFGLPARGQVIARAYLMLGGLPTLRGLAAWLDANVGPFGVLDDPVAGAELGDRAALSGWVLDDAGVDGVRVLVDGILRAELPARGARPDVCVVWPGYGACPEVGFSGEVDLSAVDPGAHLLEIEAGGRVIARTPFRRR